MCCVLNKGIYPWTLNTFNFDRTKTMRSYQSKCIHTKKSDVHQVQINYRLNSDFLLAIILESVPVMPLWWILSLYHNEIRLWCDQSSLWSSAILHISRRQAKQGSLNSSLLSKIYLVINTEKLWNVFSIRL